jgi:site-specific recombinase XerD
MQFDALIEGYLSYAAEVKRLTRRTIIDMKCTFHKALEFMEQIRPDRPLWELALDDYTRWIEHQRRGGDSAPSIGKRLCHVRGLINYAWRCGRAGRNVLEGFFIQDADRKNPPKVLTIEQAKLLIENCGVKNRVVRQKRVMILLLYGCGLRTQEICQLDISDVDRERQQLFIRKAKGDIQRYIPAPDGVWTELLAYLVERGGKRGALFLTAVKRRRISQKDVLDTVHEAAVRAGLSEITPKTLRHTFATHLMDAGVNLGVISSLMGHRSPQETGVYLHALAGRKEIAVNRLTFNTQKKEI